MDRRYYLAKLGIVAVALALAFASTGMSSGHAHIMHAASHYSAPAEVQAALWQTTRIAGRAIACLFSHGLLALL
ncbi:MAG: hypothetical protein JOY77_06655 [Alphaproteobacteria bacterium]|nr:hypothetical protein [Alphaproteobacteria bacterium]MBV9062592.1 hypothetical protein [Alphaproteobacteria bacterium]